MVFHLSSESAGEIINQCVWIVKIVMISCCKALSLTYLEEVNKAKWNANCDARRLVDTWMLITAVWTLQTADCRHILIIFMLVTILTQWIWSNKQENKTFACYLSVFAIRFSHKSRLPTWSVWEHFDAVTMPEAFISSPVLDIYILLEPPCSPVTYSVTVH